MSRRPHQSYICNDLEELARQLLFVPADKRMQQIRNAEQLHDQLEPDSNYPIDFLKFRITGHRSAEDDQAVLVGQAVLADLRLLIETISRSVSMPLTSDESAESPQELAARLNVSPRTITRWRKSGLRVRWVKLSDSSQPRLMIMRDAIEDFTSKNTEKISQASNFTQMTAAQKKELLDRARKLVLVKHVTLNQVAAHLAKRTGRALETIRQMLILHDQKNPQQAIFADRSAPLSPRQQEVIARAHKRGIKVRTMAEHFDRTYSTIYRAIRQRRAGELRKIPLSFFPAPMYEREDAMQVILRPSRLSYLPCELKTQGLPEPIANLYTQPGLPAAAMQRLLSQLNFLKYHVCQLRDHLDRYEPRVGDLNQIEKVLKQITLRKSQLARANLQLVLSAAQRQTISSPQTGLAALAELLELGNAVLFETIDQIDPSRSENIAGLIAYRLQRRFALVEIDNPKAHRKIDAAQLVARLLQQAKDAGIELVEMEK